MAVEQRLGLAFAAAHPREAARVLEGLPPGDAAAFLATLPPDGAAVVVSQMGAVMAAGCVAVMRTEDAAGVLATLPPTAVASVLRQLSEPWPMLRALPEPLRDTAAGLLRFPEGTAGALADPAVLTVPEDLSVGEVQKLLRRTPERVSFNIYVVDQGNRLVGALDLRDLMAAAATAAVAELMRRDPPRLPGGSDLSTVAAHPRWLEHETLPVVDETGILLGVIRHQTLRRMVREGTSGVIGPLVNLAELYWTGFSRMVFGFGEAATTRTARPGAGTEASDDN